MSEVRYEGIWFVCPGCGQTMNEHDGDGKCFECDTYVRGIAEDQMRAWNRSPWVGAAIAGVLFVGFLLWKALVL